MRPLTTAKDVLEGLRDHYRHLGKFYSTLERSPYVLLDEVRLSAIRRGDAGEDSRIDALAVKLDRADPPTLIGHEIKVDRQDLEAELANSSKREPWQKVVSEFYLVAPLGVTSAEEIEFSAPDLGLMEFDPVTGEIHERRRGFSTRRIPEPTWPLVVALLRSATR